MSARILLSVLVGASWSIVACAGGSIDGGGDLADNPSSGDPTSEAGTTPSGGDLGSGSLGDGGSIGPGTTPDPTIKVGRGGTPFDPRDDGSAGVKVDPSGNIVIDPKDFGGSALPVIWVANSAEGTVSKLDTRTMKELARYRTCPLGDSACDPSRTTVNLSGDVVVVNRGGASATKIASDPVDCIGPGAGTSKGGKDVRAWGDDKCVLWNTPFTPGVLGRAGAFDAERGIDGALSTSVWVGEWASSKMLQMDSKTGKLLSTVDVSPIKPYGAAVDKDHHIWVWGGGVGFIDAATHVWTRIEDPPCAYGIAVDPKGRVWTSGWTGTGGCVARYTPSLGKWESIPVGTQGRGIAIDAKGGVWTADTDFGVHHIAQDTFTVLKNIPLAIPGSQFVGMAIDFDGTVWTVDRGGNRAIKIDPTTYAANAVAVGNGPYTYSDMTGFQLRNAAAPFGKYRHVFAGCGTTAKWATLSWVAKTDAGTTITVRARTGPDPTALKAAAWKLVAHSPGDVPPIDLAKALGDAAKAQYIEVEFELDATDPTITPILSSIDVTSACPPMSK